MEHLPPSFLEPVPELLAQIFGSNAASASYQVLNQHKDYCVLSAQIERPFYEVIFKLAGRTSPMEAAFERTAFIHKLIRSQTEVPIADIVAVDMTYARFPWRYLIQTRIPGKVWATIAPQLDTVQRYNAYVQIGRAVAQIHSIQFRVFGEIASAEADMPFVDALLQRAERTIQQKHLRERFVEVVKDRRALFESVNQAVLCHDDLHHYNVLFDDEKGSWKLAGILDFDKAWAGHSETDLARLSFWDNMMGEGFTTGYGTIHALEPGYEERQLVYQLLWGLEYAVQTPRHRTDLQRLCQGLDLAPIVL